MLYIFKSRDSLQVLPAVIDLQKLSTRYLVDIEVNANLQDMILLEVAIGESTTITESLLWLTR